MNQRIVVGVSGGIAAYKSAILVSKLVQRGFSVSVVLTEGAQHFIGAATFAALCNQDPITDVFDRRFPLGAHIELASDCRLMIVAPATAHVISSFAMGTSDSLLATLYLNLECPILVAPAMSTPMWDKPAVRRNVQQLQEDGVHLVGPDSGWLSCRKIGTGRMAEPETILAACEPFLS
jgi:phosphopantothenoylcysteine decarboxylase